MCGIECHVQLHGKVNEKHVLVCIVPCCLSAIYYSLWLSLSSGIFEVSFIFTFIKFSVIVVVCRALCILIAYTKSTVINLE